MLKPFADRLTAVLLAWVGAAATTAALTMIGTFGYFVFLLVLGATGASAEPLDMLLGIPLLAMFAGAFAMLYALGAYAIGLAIFSAPAWWALHKLKLTNPLAFALTGAGLSAAGGVVTGMEYLPFTPLLAIPGGVAGWVIWLLGYTRAQAASEAST